MEWVLLIPSLIITGLIVGALGRLIVPGRNPMSLLATIGIGIAGAVIGGLIGYVIGANLVIVFLLEIAAAALLVWLVSGRSRAARV
jgi:uncharacterized membrane protein YeaQ/YmgE (transglycosylase-associated protein family)